jgi:hypothetical protein
MFKKGDRVRPDKDYAMCSKTDVGFVERPTEWDEDGVSVRGYYVNFDTLTGPIPLQLMFFEVDRTHSTLMCPTEILIKIDDE